MALYTASLRLTLPAVGEYSNTWGTVVNNGITSLTDSAIAGLAEIAMPDANYTLTVVNGSADEARRMALRLFGALTAPRAVICPAAPKLYFVTNATNAVVTIRTASGTGTEIGVGESAVVRCDGTNVVPAVTAVNGTLIPADDVLVTPTGTQTLTNKTFNLANNTFQGTLPIANGGTGQTTRQAAMDALAGAVTAGQYLRGDGTDVVMSAIQAADVPTLNQNTTGTAANVTGIVAVANGGTNANNASGARTNLGATTIGGNLFTLANPSAIRFPRFNADNTVSSLTAADFRTAIGAGTGGGSVTSVTGTGTVSGLTLTGTVVDSGNLTLGGTLAVLPSNFESQTLKTVLAAPNAADGTPTFRALLASDIPTLNQNTTGTAANVTGIVAIANGGTGATTDSAARTALGATTVGANLFTLANPGAITFPRFNADNTVSSLTDSAFRTAIGATTIGSNLFTLPNPGEITFPRFNANNTVSALSAADFRTAIGAGTSSATGTVTSVATSGTVSGLTLTGGTITTTGTITLGGTLSVLPSDFASQTANTVLAAPNGANGVPTFRALVASDIPTLNQNTTGTAANVTGTVALANGGTGATTDSAARTNLGATTVGSNLFTLANPGAITFPRFNANNTVSALTDAEFRTAIGVGTGTGTVLSVDMTVPTGLSVAGGPITSSGTLAVTFAAGYSIPTTTSQTNWDTAYTDRLKWDGGSTDLVAATGRTSLGATTIGGNLFTLANPGAITFPRFNADNTVSALTAATFRTAIGAGTGDGNVTLTGTETLTNKTLTKPTINEGYAEQVTALGTATLSSLTLVSRGSIQTITLSANSSPTDGLLAGQSLTLMVEDGSAYTITWPSVAWKTNNGAAPSLNTTGFTVIQLWKVGTTLYGARVGDA